MDIRQVRLCGYKEVATVMEMERCATGISSRALRPAGLQREIRQHCPEVVCEGPVVLMLVARQELAGLSVEAQLRDEQFSSESSWLPLTPSSSSSGLSVMLGSLVHCR